MHAQKQSFIGLSTLAVCVVALAGILLAFPAHAHNPAAMADDIRLCVQRFRDDISDRNLTRAQRRALRVQLRLCIHAAVKHEHGSSSHSSMNFSSSSTTHSSRSSASSGMSSTSVSSSSQLSSVMHVSIENRMFSPAALTIKKGTTVIWTNDDYVSHTVTSTIGNELNSGVLTYNHSYSHTFSGTGSYTYRCSFHPSMVGSIHVTN